MLEEVLRDAINQTGYKGEKALQAYILKMLCDGEYIGYTDYTDDEINEAFDFFESKDGLKFIAEKIVDTISN